MAKTIGQLRAEGKSFKEIGKIGEKELKQTSKGRAALKRLKRSVGGRGGMAGKTQAQVEAEERTRKAAETKRLLDAKAKLDRENKLRDDEAKRVKNLKIRAETQRLTEESEDLKRKTKFVAFKSKTTFTPSKPKTTFKPKQKPLSERKLEILKDAPKDIAVGLFEVGKEILSIPPKAIKGSFNFGKNLRKRFDNGENNPLFNDVKRLGQGTVSVAKFVKDDPKGSAVIVGLAATSLGTQLQTEFIKNPVKTTTKAVAYLFPGTIIKGGVKTVGLGTKGVKGVIQAKRLLTLEKTVKPLMTAGLTVTQLKKIDRAVGTASKISKSTVRDAKLKTALKTILKEKGIKPIRGGTVKQLISQVKASKVQPIKILTKKSRAVKKPSKVKPITLTQLKKAKVGIGETVKIVRTVKGRKTIQRFKITKSGGFKKVTKAEFTKIQSTAKKVAKVKPKKVLPKKLDVKEAAEKAFNRRLAEQGVVKEKGVTFIDLNAVKRIENSKVPVKAVRKSKWGKKAQVRFNSQVQTQVRRKVKALKEIGKISREKAKQIKKDLITLKRLIRLNPSVIVRAAGLIKLIDSLIGQATAVEQGQIPSRSIASDVAKDFDQIRKPATKPIQETRLRIDQILDPKRPSPPQKQINKLKKRIIKKPKKIIEKPPKIPRLRFNLKNLKKKGSRQGFIIRIKEGNKIISQTRTALPENRATNLMRRRLDNAPQASGTITPTGRTSIVDVQKTVLANKFRVKRSKKTKVLRNVEKSKYRLDKRGEKAISRKPKRVVKKKAKKPSKVSKKKKKVSKKSSKGRGKKK